MGMKRGLACGMKDEKWMVAKGGASGGTLLCKSIGIAAEENIGRVPIAVALGNCLR